VEPEGDLVLHVVELVELVGVDVELGVAVAVDPQHLGHQRRPLAAGERHDPGPQAVRVDGRPQCGQVDAVAQVGGGGREDVTAGEGRSRGRQPVQLLGQLDRPGRSAGERDGRCQQAVVGTDQHTGAVAHLDGQRPPVRAHAGVDHGQDHTGRDVLDAAGEGQRAGPDVVRRDLVGQVDDGGVGGDVTDDRLHHPDELVGGAVVRQKRHGVVAGRHGSR
jgi:hypothetical protein